METMERTEIGKFLYQERKKRHLTQKNFLGGIVSVSQYSRVESGEQDLRTSEFFKIVQLNHINITNLLNPNDQRDNKELEDKKLNELAIAFYERDLDKIKQIKDESKKNDAFTTLLLDATLMEKILENNLDDLDPKIIEKFSKKLDEAEDWTTDKIFLQLFGSSMMIFNMDRLNMYMKKIVKRYGNTINQYSFERQRRIGSICINYLGRSYKDNDRTQLSQVLLILYNMPAIPDLLMYKLLGQYFEALFTNDQKKVNELLKVLSFSGYEKFIMNLPK